ncbi:MAG: threonine synthase [Actinomycetia bacterium]|nr:threonine synthase [Actinomycetes bacterium]
MKYVSTRGQAPMLGFADVLLAGLASDGGLYVPQHWPKLPALEDLRGLDYAQLAAEVMWPYVAPDGPPVAGDLDRESFDRLVAEAYGTFDADEVCPISEVGGISLVELFHGPTLAFKDVALQLVGRLFDHVLTGRDGRVAILGATSGDTGSAAMDAFRGRQRADCVILFPDGRVSDVQRRQMTTIMEPNCHAVAVDGTFDDCQDLVKAAFADVAFRSEVHLSAVNSINWGRVMAQVVYYVWAQLRVAPEGGPVSFCVPTGNFGNILAGWVAKQMGLPVDRLIVASNRNDILTRFFTTGAMEVEPVVPTTSPSMDIQVSSNLERLLFEVLGRDGSSVAELLTRFRADGRVAVPADVLETLRSEFDAGRLEDSDAAEVIDSVYEADDVLLDPHTAVGVGVAQQMVGSVDTPVVCMATAHPAKFPDAVFEASGVRPPLPAHLADLMDRPERIEHAANDLGAVEAHVRRVLAVAN